MSGIIKVASAVLIENGRIFLSQRTRWQSYGGALEMPGGTVEPGESVRQAACREMKEETNLDVVATGKHFFEYLNGKWLVHYVPVRRVSDAPARCLDVASVGWYDLPWPRDMEVMPSMVGAGEEAILEYARRMRR